MLNRRTLFAGLAATAAVASTAVTRTAFAATPPKVRNVVLVMAPLPMGRVGRR